MGVMGFKTILDSYKKIGVIRLQPGAKKSQIATFEKKEGLHFSNQLKTWFRLSDGGELFLPAGVQFYGVCHKPVIDPHDTGAPDDSFVVIGSLANGDPVIWKKNSEQIAIYNKNAGRIEEDEIYEDMISFFKDIPALLGVVEV